MPMPFPFHKTKKLIMKKIKIYGVYSMVEWRAVIPCDNGVRLNVLFEGGSVSSHGTIPAKFRTEDEVIQALIESSDFYKRGKIKLVKTIEVPNTNVVANSNTNLKVNNKPTIVETKKEKQLSVETPKAEKSTNQEENTPSGLKVVSVSDIEGAGRKYLIDNYGVTANKLRGIESITKQAKAHGIEFVVE